MKNLTIMLEPATYSWLIEAARRAGAFPDAFVEELVERERRRDEAGSAGPLASERAAAAERAAKAGS